MKTKIVATIGPASLTKNIFNQMVEEGMAIARINTKYGSIEQYEEIFGLISNTRKCQLLFDIKIGDTHSASVMEWLKGNEFDYLALSFAESAEEIEKARKNFPDKAIKIIAKIETQKGLDNLEEIINASDGIMVARGDLGRNILLADVPLYQKLIIKKCNEFNKMVITATEMLLSMTDSKTPERAEVSDVANAVLDGSNYLMLSEETSIGKYPVLAIKMMAEVIREIEKKSYMLDT